jgi:hypothetical protein
MQAFDELINPVVKPVKIMEAGNRKGNKTLEQQLYDAVTAKMKIRTSNVGSRTVSNTVNNNTSTASNKPEKTLLSERVDPPFMAEVTIPSGTVLEMSNLLVNLKNKEVEASFGSIDSQEFFPGIKSASDFVNLRKFLMTSTSPKFNYTISEDVVEIMENFMGKGNIRCRYDIAYPNDKIYENKIRNKDSAILIHLLNVRITTSFEKEVDGFVIETLQKKWEPHMRRVRRRVTFSTRTTSSPLYGFDIDTTIVDETKLTYVEGVETAEKTRTKYEIEIEAKKEKLTGENFKNAIIFIYNSLTANLSRVDLFDKIEFNVSTRIRIVKLHNFLFEKDIAITKWKNKDKFLMFGNYWNKPENIKLKDLQPTIVKKEVKERKPENRNIKLMKDFLQLEPVTIRKEYKTFHFASSFPTIKLNGKRMFLLVLRDESFLIMPPYTITKVGIVKDSSLIGDGTYIDGEYDYKTHTFHFFDILFHNSEDVRNLPFLERYNLVKECFKYSSESIKFFYTNIAIKHFETEGGKSPDAAYDRIRKIASEYLRMVEKDPDSTDGIIIQPSHKYFNETTLKWKPVDKLTIDFKLIQATLEDVKQFEDITLKNYKRTFFLTMGKNQNVFRPKNSRDFEGNTVNFQGYITLDKTENSGMWINAIAECKWNYNLQTFVPILLRDDRTAPNNIKTVFDVWEDIMNPINLDTIMGENLVIMRKLHNRVKNDMLKTYLKKSDNIIDIGSGRGGDLNKWQKIELNTVYAVEPDLENGEEFMTRLREMQKSKKEDNTLFIKLLSVGAEETEKISKKVDVKINAITSFFSLTYFGESSEKYQGLMDTINLIPEGGYFIGSVMDGNRVKILLEKERVKLTRSMEVVLAEADILTKEFEDLSIRKDKFNAKKFDRINVINREVNLLLEEAESKTPHALLRNQLKDLKLKLAIEKKKSKTENLTTISAISQKIEKYKALLQLPEFVPADEDSGSLYTNKAFNIIQVSEFDDDPIGNVIEVNINDETSMVKEQIEWLFNFDFFSGKMASLGFTLIENRFIESINRNDYRPDEFVQILPRVMDENADFLSKESLAWSRLNRVFCFQRTMQ